MTVELYALDGCPYCEAVSEALDDAGVAYETHWVEALHSKRDEVARVSGQREVPILVDPERGVTMAQSANILTYVERTLGGDTADGEATAPDGRGEPEA
ncbi:MAG: glutaredoxin family protein [Halobacteriaceae archaeon]